MATTPQAAAAKWRDRLSQSTQAITEGVNSVTEAPGVAAARQKQAWIQRITASQDKWARNVARVPLDEWRRKMIEVGIPRVASGAAANVGKVETFLGEFLPHLDAGVRQVRAMPKGSLQDSINRMVAMVNHNAKFRRGGSAGA